MLEPKNSFYPQAGPQAGRLLRKIILFLRQQNVSIPITSHILIAISGGPDSVALAHLIIHLGRRIVDRKKIILLHINHGWRGAESDADEAFVQSLANAWSVPFICHRLSAKDKKNRDTSSLEEKARIERNRIFQEEALKYQALIFTAHQADDLAETLLWRIFSGNAQIQGGGIFFQHEAQIRPLLVITKNELLRYLEEVRQPYRVDATNFEGRFLRSKMRIFLMPQISKLFPKAVEHLVRLGLNAQHQQESIVLPDSLTSLIKACGIKARRPHWEVLQKVYRNKKVATLGVDLPDGWRLTYIPCAPAANQAGEKWILEKLPGSSAEAEN